MTAVKMEYLGRVHILWKRKAHVTLLAITANICMTAATLRCLLISPYFLNSILFVLIDFV